MSKAETFTEWTPNVLGRERLDKLRWAYIITAPFDMPADIPGLIGITVHLDGHPFEICGTLPRVPQLPIKKGELVGLLVRSMRLP